VNWEIRKANELGKRILGVYARGGTEADIPAALNDYGDAIVNWNADSIISAVEGQDNSFKKPDGASREPTFGAATSRC
jgi:hypothetical protein